MAPPEVSVADIASRQEFFVRPQSDNSNYVPQESVDFHSYFQGFQRPLCTVPSKSKPYFLALIYREEDDSSRIESTSLEIEGLNNGEVSSSTEESSVQEGDTEEEKPCDKGPQQDSDSARLKIEGMNNAEPTTVSESATPNGCPPISDTSTIAGPNFIENKLEERRKIEVAFISIQKIIDQFYEKVYSSKFQPMISSYAEPESQELGGTEEAVYVTGIAGGLPQKLPTHKWLSKAGVREKIPRGSTILSKDVVCGDNECSGEKGENRDQPSKCQSAGSEAKKQYFEEKQNDCMESQVHPPLNNQGSCSANREQIDCIGRHPLESGQEKKGCLKQNDCMERPLKKHEKLLQDPGGGEPLDSEQSNSSSSSSSSSKSEGGDGSGSSQQRSKRKKASQNPHGHQGGTDESEDDDDGRTPPGQQNLRKDHRVFSNIKKDGEQAHQNSVSPPEAFRNQSADQPRSQYNSKPPPPRPQTRNSSGVIEGSEPDSRDASAVESDHEVQHKQRKRIRDTGYQSIPTGLLHIAGQDDDDTNAVGAQCPTYTPKASKSEPPWFNQRDEALVGLRSPAPSPRDNEVQNVTPNLAVQDNNVSEGSAPAPPVGVDRPAQDQYPHVMVADYDGANQQDLYERPVEESRDQAMKITEIVVYRPYLPPVRDPRPSHLRPLSPVLEDSLTYSMPVTYNLIHVRADESCVLYTAELYCFLEHGHLPRYSISVERQLTSIKLTMTKFVKSIQISGYKDPIIIPGYLLQLHLLNETSTTST